MKNEPIESREETWSVFQCIQNTALELFSKRGYENVSVEDVCAAADLTKPTFYRHVASKKALFLSFFQVTENELSFLQDLKKYADPIQGILTIYRFFFEVCSQYGRDMFTTLIQLTLLSPRAEFDPKNELKQTLLHLIDKGQRNGTINNDLELETMLSVLNSYYYGYCFFYCSRAEETGGMEECCSQMRHLLETGGKCHEG